jgi:hypothetical protein
MSDSGNSHLKADWRQRTRSERLNPPCSRAAEAVFSEPGLKPVYLIALQKGCAAVTNPAKA